MSKCEYFCYFMYSQLLLLLLFIWFLTAQVDITGNSYGVKCYSIEQTMMHIDMNNDAENTTF